MKQLRKYLPLVCGGLGAAGMALRFWLLRTGFDEKGLLLEGHIGNFLVALTAAAALAAVVAALWGRQEAPRSRELFPASLPAAVAAALGCVGILLSAWTVYTQAQTMLMRITWLLGAVAFMAGLLLAWCRYKGLRPHFLLRSLVTLYFMFHLVYHYQRWFSETQTALYAAQLLAQVLLILAGYHRTALEANLGGRKQYIFTSQLAGFFCLLAIPGAEKPLFYAAMAFWLLADAGNLQPREEEPAHEAA